MLTIDIDDFKTVNEGLGHSRGDEAIVEVGRRLRGVLRPSDTVARLGGDEFAILLEDLSEPAGATGVAERIMLALSSPVKVTGGEVELAASIGVAVSGAQLDDADELDPRRRPRDVRREVRGQGALPLVRGLDAVRRRRAPGARARPQARDPARRARGPLPARRRHDDRPRARRRGARALDASRARPDLPGRVHPARRAERDDRAARPAHARARMRRPAGAAPWLRRAGHGRQRQPVGRRAARARARRAPRELHGGGRASRAAA